MSDYTPSTDVVRAEYWEHGAYRYGAARGDEFQAEFDRWLAAHDADHEKAVRERIAQDIEAAGREDVAWLADGPDTARVVGAEDAWKSAIRIAREGA